jgi:hypothetical protein
MANPVDFLIPLTNTPQTFQILLAGVTYTWTVKWNPSPDAGWTLDIADINAVPIACNIPFITGDDLLDGLAYLGFSGILFVMSTGSNPFEVPTFDNLGVNSNLFFETSNPNE